MVRERERKRKEKGKRERAMVLSCFGSHRWHAPLKSGKKEKEKENYPAVRRRLPYVLYSLFVLRERCVRTYSCVNVQGVLLKSANMFAATLRVTKAR